MVRISADDLLRRYRTGERDFRHVDLTGADLQSQELPGLVLCGADLTRTDLQYAVLTGADLSGAELHGTYLSHADLTHAKLVRDNMHRV